jgi:hypothetical protein
MHARLHGNLGLDGGKGSLIRRRLSGNSGEFERYNTEQRRIEATSSLSDFYRLVDTTGKLGPTEPRARRKAKEKP